MVTVLHRIKTEQSTAKRHRRTASRKLVSQMFNNRELNMLLATMYLVLLLCALIPSSIEGQGDNSKENLRL